MEFVAGKPGTQNVEPPVHLWVETSKLGETFLMAKKGVGTPAYLLKFCKDGRACMWPGVDGSIGFQLDSQGRLVFFK